jgi:hypothetical protein
MLCNDGCCWDTTGVASPMFKGQGTQVVGAGVGRHSIRFKGHS